MEYEGTQLNFKYTVVSLQVPPTSVFLVITIAVSGFTQSRKAQDYCKRLHGEVCKVTNGVNVKVFFFTKSRSVWMRVFGC